MSCHNPQCMGNYDFDHIVLYAIKRFVEGWNTVDLLGTARTEREKEEIALVCMLHLDNDTMDDLQLSCKCEGQCKAIVCRNKLKRLIRRKIGKSI